MGCLVLGWPAHLQQVLQQIDSYNIQDQQKVSYDSDVPNDYEMVTGLFKQTDITTNDTTFDIIEENFGLKPGINWNTVMNYLQAESKSHSRKAVYKLFFLARHGEGYHNIAPGLYNSTDWTCKYQMEFGNKDIEWYDATLTSKGKEQILQLSEFWEDQLNEHQAPEPQSYYVSPLRRTLQTFDLTWNNIIKSNTVPVIKEFARETYGIGTESRRHSKQYIAENWPGMAFEWGFKERDELWESDYYETHQHRDFRARMLLNEIFANDSNTVISLTAHRGIIKSILKVIKHRKWNLKTGEVIPVLIKGYNFGPFEPPRMDRPWHRLPNYCNTD